MRIQKPIRGHLPNLTKLFGRGLILDLPFNEHNADKVFDMSGRKHDGTLKGNVAWVGGALKFPGAAGDYIDIGNHGGSVKSVAMWVNPDAVNVTDYLICLDGSVYVRIKNGILQSGSLPGTQVFYVNGRVGTTITANWHFIVWISTWGFTASNLDIGRMAGSDNFAGLMNNVMLWNRELLADEARLLSEMMYPLYED